MNQKNKANPRISVIVPSLNQGQYLRQCLDSILAQQYPNLELLVIDGGSQDCSIDIIQAYQSQIHYWVSEPDQGQSDAINKGFRRATGSLVAWLNSDDYYLPNAFSHLLTAYSNCPDASFYFGNGFRVDASGQKIESFFKHEHVSFSRKALLYGLNYILQPSTFINAHHLKQANYLDESLRYGMDTDLWIRLSKLAFPVPIQAHLAASREYTMTKTATGGFRRSEELRLIAKQHTGVEMTPGSLCYFLDTLNRFAATQKDVFPNDFQRRVEALWVDSQKAMKRYGCDEAGFPTTQASAESFGESQINLKFSGTGRSKIGIDLRNVVMGESGGLAQLIRGVFREVFLKDPAFDYIVFCTIFSRGLIPSFEAENVTFVTLSIDNYYPELDRIAQLHNISLLFRDYPVKDSLKFSRQRQIFLIPDIQHETFPNFFTAQVLRDRRDAFDVALSEAGAIATLSEYARKTLLEYPKTRCQDIFLTPPALQVEHAAEVETEPLSSQLQAMLNRRYFLLPANIWPHKNHRRILQAFEQFVHKTQDDDINLVLTGNQNGWPELAKEFSHLPIHHFGFVSAQALRALYQNAIALTFFSLYEGFGMPLLEAFNSETPVICSNTTSLPEVGSDAVLTCDPTDVQAISHLMEKVAKNSELRASLIAKGRRRLNYYTWRRSANSLEEAFKRLSESIKQTDEQLVSSNQLATSEASIAEISTRNTVVSIVTPSFNQGRFIKRTIDSVLSQSYPHIEYIVIDGGSTDNTIDILKSYGDNLKWISEPDGGQTDAINKGFKMTHGEIRAYLNSDDVLLPGTIEYVVEYFSQYPTCDLLYGNANYIDPDDRITGQYKTADYSFARLMDDCCICQPATFWRTQLSKRIGPFDDQLNYVMDYEYWLKAAHAGADIHHVSQFLANSRLYQETKTLSARGKIYQEIFKVCLALSGYVSLSYVQGLWHYRCYEKDWGILTPVIRLPRLYRMIAFGHHKWLNSQQYLSVDSFISIYSNAKIKLRNQLIRYRLFRPLKKLLRKLKSVSVPQLRAASYGKVIGIDTDNWMSPVCYINLPKPYRQGSLYIAGIAPLSMTLSIFSHNKEIISLALSPNCYEKIEFSPTFEQAQNIKFVFSDSFVDSSGRKLSFLLQDTNIFLEKDFF